MALATLHIAVFPVLAGLVAGTGAVATYVAAPAAPVVEGAAASRDCTAQAWPYVDRGCVVGAAAAPEDRTVRLVAAPRASEAFEGRWVDIPPTPVTPAGPGLTTSDGVLRQPQNVDAIPTVSAAAPPRAKHQEVKREKRTRAAATRTPQPYQVPDERSGEIREVIVIRPLRYD